MKKIFKKINLTFIKKNSESKITKYFLFQLSLPQFSKIKNHQQKSFEFFYKINIIAFLPEIYKKKNIHHQPLHLSVCYHTRKTKNTF